jgi:hypothetical protein
MEFNHDWEIKSILDYFIETYRCIDDYDFNQQDFLTYKCSRAIELTCQDDGFVMPIEMFREWVKVGSITDYDGFGYFLDYEGNRLDGDIFNKSYHPADALLVAWYNK